jgi:quinoprotein glucose dehydrogenase
MHVTRPLILLMVIAGCCSTLAAAPAVDNPAELEMKKLQLGPGLKIGLYASEPLLQNPVAFSFDEQGRCFVVETHRYRNSIFDITANTPWLLDDLSFRAVNDRAAFLARTFATNSSVLTTDSELIRLVEDRNGDGQAETTSVFASGFNEAVSGTAAGVLAHGSNVWLTCIPDLWRFDHPAFRASGSVSNASISPTENSKIKTRNRLVTGLGVHISVSGHDVHGLVLGPDGRIYFSFGDRGVCVTNREGVVLNVPDTGGVLRGEPDGRNLEIFCVGLRNPQELAFDDLGNLWTVDNDTAGADPCRVLHLLQGGDYGWRMSYQHMKGFGPWVQEELWRGGLDGTLPPAGTVSQGPAGLAFYPGTGMGDRFAETFVHADFPGGIWAFTLKPKGASFELAAKEKLLWNCWPTDLEFGPDGALYVLDWVQGWSPPGKGRIYRLTAATNANPREAARVQRLLADGMSSRSEKDLLTLFGHKDRRVRLEAQWELVKHGSSITPKLVELAIESRNRLARLHALWGLATLWRHNPPAWRRKVSDPGFDLMAELLPLLRDSDEAIRAGVADLLGELHFLNADVPTKELFKDSSMTVRTRAVLAQGRILSGFSGNRGPREKISRFEQWSEVLREVTKAETRGSSMRHPIPEIQELSRGPSSHDPFVIFALSRLYEDIVGLNLKWNSPAGIVYTNHFLNLGTNLPSRLAGLLAYRRRGYDGITNFIADPNPSLVLEAVRAINDEPIEAGYPALAAMLNDPRFEDTNWVLQITRTLPASASARSARDQALLRVLNAHFRLGQADNAEALVRFAASLRADGPLRAEALFLLGAWEVLPATPGNVPFKPAKDPNHGSTPSVNPENWPGWFDRVVGLWRPLPPRSREMARLALAPHIGKLVADDVVEVAVAALQAAVKLQLTNATPVLLARLKDPATPVVMRQQIPAALAAINPFYLAEAVPLALKDGETEVRIAALPYLDRLSGDQATVALDDLVRAAITRRESPEQAEGESNSKSQRAGGYDPRIRLAQAALAALGTLKSREASQTLRSLLADSEPSHVPAALELDVLEAAARHDDPEIKSLLARRQPRLSKEDPIGPWRSTLVGGDAERGRTIFLEKADVQCSRCHAVKGQGGIVGPALDKIARQRSREYLLEAVILPNKAMASGFENVVIMLKNGVSHAGLVKSEDEGEVRLESPEAGPVQIPKSDIASRRRGLSAMPEGVEQFLTRRELRDLVEYLATLK